MPIKIEAIDHLVLTVRDIDASCEFYSNTLGMEVITFGNKRKALKFGRQKINLHQYRQEFEPKANQPTPGSTDICLISSQPVETIIDELNKQEISIIEGPVTKTGATGKIVSVYIRDPDGNLLEIGHYSNRLT